METLTLTALIERKFLERRRTRMEALLNSVKDYSEYKYIQGYLQGIHDFWYDDVGPYVRDPESANDEALVGGDR